MESFGTSPRPRLAHVTAARMSGAVLAAAVTFAAVSVIAPVASTVPVAMHPHQPGPV